MNQHDEVVATAELIAAAIARRDVATIQGFLAPGFIQRTHGGSAVDEEAFLQAIQQIPGDIVRVGLEQIKVDMSPTGALVTGVQHAQVQIEGQLIEERRGFVDWFVRQAGEWRIQAAVDLPGPDSP